MATATAAKLLAKRARFPNSEKAFTAGLLHDIGKVMIARYLPMSLAAIVQAVREEGLPMALAEQRTIGLAHPAFGAWVMARWGLPSALIEAVEFHHCPTKAQYSFDLAAIVYLANALTHRAGIGSGGDTLPREIDPADFGTLRPGRRRAGRPARRPAVQAAGDRVLRLRRGGGVEGGPHPPAPSP